MPRQCAHWLAMTGRIDTLRGTIPSDGNTLSITAGVGNEEDTGGPPGAYFLTDEKVCKESPGNFRRFPGPFGRPKREADKVVLNPAFPPLPPWESPWWRGEEGGAMREADAVERG